MRASGLQGAHDLVEALVAVLQVVASLLLQHVVVHAQCVRVCQLSLRSGEGGVCSVIAFQCALRQFVLAHFLGSLEVSHGMLGRGLRVQT